MFNGTVKLRYLQSRNHVQQFDSVNISHTQVQTISKTCQQNMESNHLCGRLESTRDSLAHPLCAGSSSQLVFLLACCSHELRFPPSTARDNPSAQLRRRALVTVRLPPSPVSCTHTRMGPRTRSANRSTCFVVAHVGPTCIGYNSDQFLNYLSDSERLDDPGFRNQHRETLFSFSDLKTRGTKRCNIPPPGSGACASYRCNDRQTTGR